MPRQNRGTPLGQIVAVPERGTMMGNRGVLHDHRGRIRRPWQGKRWLICRLEFRGRRRNVMAPSRYTELFFLDEATALAAGHRPCSECRRARFHAFRGAWATGNGSSVPPGSIRAGAIDERLHEERIGPGRSKRTFTAGLDELPDGVFVMFPDGDGEPHLVLGEALLTWTPAGYTGRRDLRDVDEVTVLTPRSTVAAIRAGYGPEVHPSALP